MREELETRADRTCRFERMGVIVTAGMLVLAWVLALLGVSAPGAPDGASTEILAILWLLYLPMGWMFLASGIMHTIFAKSTAKNIGWETSPFQHELGFVCFGLGIAGVISVHLSQDAWIVMAIVSSCFLVLAGLNHVKEIVRDKNFAPGNTLILVSDFGVPISIWALLLSTGTV